MPNAKDFRSWRVEKLADPEIAKGYLNDALSESWDMFLKAVLNVAQARQVAVVASEAGITRENIYRAFVEGGNPKTDTLNAVLGAVGLEWEGLCVKGSRKAESNTPSTAHSRSRRKHGRKRGIVSGDIRQLALPFGPVNVEAAGATRTIPTIVPIATYDVAYRWKGVSSNLATSFQYSYTNQKDTGASDIRVPLTAIRPGANRFAPSVQY